MSTYNEMKKKAESDQNRIELRSEKVRNMIGEMPSFLIRWQRPFQNVQEHVKSLKIDQVMPCGSWEIFRNFEKSTLVQMT